MILSLISCVSGWSQTILQVKKPDVEVLGNSHSQGCKQICAQHLREISFLYIRYGKFLISFISAHETWDQHFTCCTYSYFAKKQSILHSCCQTYPCKTDYPTDPRLRRCHLQNSLQHSTQKIGCSLSQCHPFCHQSPIYYLSLRTVCSRWLAFASYSSPNPLAPGHL